MGVIASFLVTYFVIPHENIQDKKESEPTVITKKIDFKNYKISSFMRAPGEPVYFQLDNGSNRLTSSELTSTGYQFEIVSSCQIIIRQGEKNEIITCH